MLHIMRCFLLLYMLCLIFHKGACRLRYTHLGVHYEGQFSSEIAVGSCGECAVNAYRSNKVGYRISRKSGKTFCSLLTTFKRFKNVEDESIRDYILSTNVSDSSCNSGNRNVTALISGPCALEGAGCNMLSQIKDLCSFTGSDTPSCISAKSVTFTEMMCPPGRYQVMLEKGKLLCCPKGENLMTKLDGKAYCCPPSKVLKQILDGKAICCLADDNYEVDIGICCPKGSSYQKSGAHGECCEEGTTLKKAQNGKFICCGEKEPNPLTVDDQVMCCASNHNILAGSKKTGYTCASCPSGELFIKKENGIDHCCPPGESLQDTKNGKAICCEKGQVVKGYFNGVKRCCNAKDSYDEVSGICCPPGKNYQKLGEVEICCPDGDTLNIAPNGIPICCRKTHPKAVNNEKGEAACCFAVSNRVVNGICFI